MKTKTIKITIGAALFVMSSLAQNSMPAKPGKKTITVLNIDSKGLLVDAAQMGDIVRIELEKVDTFEVMDRYDVSYLLDKNKLKIDNCYGKLCLVDVGSAIKSEKMFTGSVELYGESIIITMRLIDVASSKVEKTQVMEFLNLPNEVQAMIGITIREMFGFKNDKVILASLTKHYNYENSTNNPNQSRLDLNGSRMGFTVFTGKTASILHDSKSNGGFDAFPMMFQFGYQFEKQYLNEGNFQALFEVIPLITGLDQGLFIPSITFMHGLRDDRNGWEFAFGPTINFVKEAQGYYDNSGQWHVSSDWQEKDANFNPIPNPYAMVYRMDSRGTAKLNTGFVFAFGRTLKSGKLNIPMNLYVIPSNSGWSFGASFGFNSKK